LSHLGDCLQTEDEPAMSEMVESTITSHTYVAHVPVPSQKEVTCTHIAHSPPALQCHMYCLQRSL